MASGSKTVKVTDHDNLVFKWEESNVNTSNNTSTIKWTLSLVSDSNGRISSTASKSYSVSIAGKSYSGTNTVGISASTTKTLASNSFTVTHKSDGSYSFSYSFSQTFGITFSGKSIGTISGSGTGSLSTIAQASTMTIGSTGKLGTSQNIAIKRGSSTYYHRIVARAYVGSTVAYTQNVLGSSGKNSSATSCKWTPAMDLAKGNTSGKTVSVTVTIYTYESSTSTTVKKSISKTVSCTIPDSVKPKSLSLTFSDTTANKDKTTGKKYFIKGLSKVKWSASASAQYGASLKSMKLVLNGTTYTGTPTNSKWEKSLTSAWGTAGTFKGTLTVTDSRGFTNTTSTSFTVADYSKPTISKLNAHRTNSTSTSDSINEDIVGNNIYTVSTFSACTKKDSSGNLLYSNTITKVVFRIKQETGDFNGNYTQTTSNPTPLSNFMTLFTSANSNDKYINDSNSYVIEAAVTDSFGQTVKKTTSVSTAFCLFHFAPSGTSLALGRICNNSTYGATGSTAKVLDIGFDNVYIPNGTASSGNNLTISSGFKKYNGDDNNIPSTKRFGSIVELQGTLEPTTTQDTSGTTIIMATNIASSHRPKKTKYFICQGSGMNRWLLTVYTDGSIGVSRYGTGSSYEKIKKASDNGGSNGSWLTFNVTYMV